MVCFGCGGNHRFPKQGQIPGKKYRKTSDLSLLYIYPSFMCTECSPQEGSNHARKRKQARSPDKARHL